MVHLKNDSFNQVAINGELSKEADLELSGDDGFVMSHKFFLISKLPFLRPLLCQHCDFSHGNTAIFVPGVRVATIRLAIYKMFNEGNVTLLEDLLMGVDLDTECTEEMPEAVLTLSYT